MQSVCASVRVCECVCVRHFFSCSPRPAAAADEFLPRLSLLIHQILAADLAEVSAASAGDQLAALESHLADDIMSEPPINLLHSREKKERKL